MAFTIVTGIDVSDPWPGHQPIETTRRQYVSLALYSEDDSEEPDVRFEGIPEPPQGTRWVIGESWETQVHSFGEPKDWREDTITHWVIYVPSGVAYYRDDLIARTYED